MRRGIWALGLAVAATVGAWSPPDGIRRVAWLQGCWQAVSADQTVEEQWMAPRGGSMVGSGRTVRGDTLTEYELVVIRERGEGLVYVAHPSGQPSAEFASSSVSEGRVVFENPAHDFPQRIGYERRGNSLQAWVEGTKDGRSRRIEFAYLRTACASD
jgi:Domain of unknown function (DUF6265)